MLNPLKLSYVYTFFGYIASTRLLKGPRASKIIIFEVSFDILYIWEVDPQ